MTFAPGVSTGVQKNIFRFFGAILSGSIEAEEISENFPRLNPENAA
jgi:hypothetical protein